MPTLNNAKNAVALDRDHRGRPAGGFETPAEDACTCPHGNGVVPRPYCAANYGAYGPICVPTLSFGRRTVGSGQAKRALHHPYNRLSCCDPLCVTWLTINQLLTIRDAKDHITARGSS